MTDLNAEYEKFLDQETAELMDKITQKQVMEAVAHEVGSDHGFGLVILGLHLGGSKFVANGLTLILYNYWRKTLAEKHTFDTWEADYLADAAAAKAERNHDTCEMNNGSD